MNPDGILPITFKRILARSVVVPSALLALLVAVLLGLIMSLLWAAHRVDETNQIIGTSTALLKLLVDGETGLRGYLVTGEPVFLDLGRAVAVGADDDDVH